MPMFNLPSVTVKNQIIMGLDIGTSTVKAVLADVVCDGVAPTIKVLGVGVAPAKGLKNGVVVNIDSVVGSISAAVQSAESMAGRKVKAVDVVISGEHIRGMESSGRVSIRGKEVSINDIKRVIEDASKTKLPEGDVVWHVLPQEFIIDGQAGIVEPLGMSGVRLGTKVYLVTSSRNNTQNIAKCIQKRGLSVRNVTLAPVMSSQLVLSEEEKNLGVCLLDIGCGTTDIAVYKGGVLKFASVIPAGGEFLTRDIAAAFKVPVLSAEEVKCQYGSCEPCAGIVTMPSIGGRPPVDIERADLATVIAARIDELFSVVLDVLKDAGFKDVNASLAAGVVLTGGTAKLQQVQALAAKKFSTVRIGTVSGVNGLEKLVSGPEYASVIGLLKHTGQRLGKSYTAEQGNFSTFVKWLGDVLARYF